MKFLFGVAALAALVGPAQAADIPVKAALSPAATYNWTSLYVGVHAGYGWGTNDWHTGPNGSLLGGSFEGGGAIAGGQAGLNVHLGGGWVAGLEIDASWSGVRATQDVQQVDQFGLLSTAYESKVEWLVTAAFRSGIAVDRLWVYGKLGAAVARVRHSYEHVDTHTLGTALTLVEGYETRVGPLFGFGAEYGLTSNWSAKLEYNYIPFGITNPQLARTSTVGGNPSGPQGTFPIANEQKLHLVKAGVNYRFVPAGAPVAEPARVAGFNWSGVYIGVQGGYGWGNKHWDPDVSTLFVDMSGWLGGGQIGANAQSGRAVVGVEAEGFWTGIDGELSTTTSFDFRLSNKAQWLALVTGRIGYTPWDYWLLYLKGGVAFANEEHTYSGTIGPGNSFAFAGDRLRNGWVVGAGVEHALAGAANWSVRAEYNYIDFGKVSETLPGTGTVVITVMAGNFPIKQTLQLAKVGLNYRFGAQPSTVVARY